MAKIYTLDGKLLVGSPEIRIGDKIFAIDDRTKTVRKAIKIFDKKDKGKQDDFDSAEEVLKLAFGKRYKEIEEMDLPFGAYISLMELVLSAMTGEDPEEERKEKDEGFPEQQQ